MRVPLLPALLALCLCAAAPALAGDRRDSGQGPPTEREVVDTLMEILNRQEFEGSEEEEEGLLLLLANLLSDLVDGVKHLRKTNPLLYGTIVGWLAATLLAIVGHVGWTVWKGGRGGGSRGRAGAALLDPALATRAGRDPARMLARAEAAAAAGRREEAAPWLYLALLFRLERAGRVEFDPARTGLEYADSLARRPGERRLWLDFLDLHDPVVFGERPCSAEALEEMRRRATGPLPGEGARASP